MNENARHFRGGSGELPNMAILASAPPCEPISMPQDDSKEWEHLLSQEKMILAGLILHFSTSTQSRYDLVQSRRPRARAELPKGGTRAAEADKHENGRSWALIPSTGAGQHTWMLFNLRK